MIVTKKIVYLSLITTSLLAQQGILLQDANIRTAPSIKADIIKAGVEGDVFHIIDRVKTKYNGTWYHTKRGYLFAPNMRLLSEKEVEMRNSTLSHEDIKVYAQPDTNSLEVANIPKGSKIDVVEAKMVKGDNFLWYRTKDGWINSPYINAVIPIKEEKKEKPIIKPIVETPVQEVVTHAEEKYSSRYEEGVKAYSEQEYELAIECFRDSKQEYTNAQMQLYWAKSEEKLQRKNYAIAAYERVVSLEPQNLEATMKLIELYKRNGQDEHASKIATEFDDRELTPEQRTALAQLLNANYAKLDKLSARVATKLGYDSNIASTAGDNSLDGFALALNLNPQQREQLKSAHGTMFSQTLASISYTHDLTHQGGWFAKASANAMMQFNSDASLYNTQYIKGSVAIGYKAGNSTITTPIYYSRTHYLNKDLVQNYGLAPTLSTVLSSRYILNFSLKLNEKQYIPSSMSEYDSQSYGVGSSLYYIVGGNYVSAKLSYDATSAKNKSSSVFPPKYIDNKVLGLFLTTLYRLNYGYILNADYKLNLAQYDENYYARDSLGNYYFKDSKRADTYHSLGLLISKYFYKSLKATADYRYSKNSTEYHLSDYDKHILSIGLEYNY